MVRAPILHPRVANLDRLAVDARGIRAEVVTPNRSTVGDRDNRPSRVAVIERDSDVLARAVEGIRALCIQIQCRSLGTRAQVIALETQSDLRQRVVQGVLNVVLPTDPRDRQKPIAELAIPFYIDTISPLLRST